MSEVRSKDNVLVKLFEKLQAADLSKVEFGKKAPVKESLVDEDELVPDNFGTRDIGNGVFEVDMVLSSPSGDTHKNVTVKVQANSAEDARKKAIRQYPKHQVVDNVAQEGKDSAAVVECSNCKSQFNWVKLPECKMGLVECPKCKWQVDQTGKAYEGKVPANPAGKVDAKAIKTLSEDIPGGPIQGDVPAGVPISSGTPATLVPGNTTGNPESIDQKIPEDEKPTTYTIIAQGISLKDVAQDIASKDPKRRVIADEVDPKKFMVVQSVSTS